MGIPSPGGQGPTNILLNSWSFTDTTNWLSYRGYPPVSFTNLSVSDLGAGTAVVVDSPNPAWLQYNLVESDGATNLSLGLGSLVFWFAPHWAGTNEGGTGPGVPGRLIEVGAYTEDASYGWWSLHTDAEGVNLYFSAQGSDGCETNYLCAPIDWTTNRWHMIAITYSTTTNCALYLDGELATNGPPITCLPGATAVANGFFIGSASNGTAQAHGMFDSLATYANPVDAGTVASTFRDAYPYYYLNPLNRASWASAPSYITNTPNFRAISGPGYLEYVGAVSACATNSNVWITNVTATPLTNGTTTLSFTIMGGDPSLLYDVFGTGELAGNNITNAQWAWLGQGPPCSNYEITNLQFGSAFLILGTPQDSDADGLPDAYELLVSHTDPHNPDTDGDGIMDWFGAAYFGTSTVDPYALCPSGDGWTLLQAYQNGWDPLAYYTPPPPQNVVAVLDSSGTTATITWQSGGGPVASYAVYRDAFLGSVDSTVFSFKDSWSTPPDGLVPDWTYFVRAYFTNGAYADSQPAGFTLPRLSSSMAAVRGPGGQLYLVVGSVPSDLATVRIAWPARDTSGSWVSQSLDLSASNFVNGVTALPLDAMTGYDPGFWYPGPTFAAQCISTDGHGGAISYLTPYAAPEEAPGGTVMPPYRFVDTRSHLKENLKFLLQSATLSQPFSYGCTDPLEADPTIVWFPETEFARPPSPTNYEYSGFHVFSANLNYSVLQEFRPAQENYLWRNFAYDPGDFDSSGNWTTGAYCNLTLPGFLCLYDPEYQFTATNTVPIPLALSSANDQYLFALYSYDDGVPSHFAAVTARIGVFLNETNHLYVPSGLSNVYGLSLNSVLVPDAASLFTLAAGGLPGPRYDQVGEADFFPGVESPVLQTADYYFASQTPYLSSDYNGWSGSGPLAGAAPPLPGSPTFSVTNTSPLLITGLGQPMTVSGWAKQAISNGYSGKYAYLEQYFTNASTIDGSGKMTTNSAGLLSPYGEFFPMQPGPAALLTMPDPDTGQQGTGVVNVIKLQLDVNHDGNMDLSFGGPDNTSQARPFVFWINNDCDWATYPGYPTFDPGQDKEVDPMYPGFCWDCKQAGPRSVRDLEDYARLWICGVPALTNVGYQVTLNWANVSSGSPAINLLRAVETDGGTLYLTDTNIHSLSGVPWQQIDGLSFGLKYSVTSTNTLTLPNNWFTNAGNKYFLFEGAGIGSGELMLAITQNGTNVIAQTGAWLDLHDIKDLYERAVITNSMSGAISAWTSGIDTLQQATSSALGDDTNLIVFIHGFNVGNWAWMTDSDTVFKRLYWAGYQGEFASVDWPCVVLSVSTVVDYGLNAFNRSELNAYKAGAAMKTYLTQLHDRLPDHQLNLLVHSQGNAAVSEAIEQGAPFDTYILTQGALPDSAYDVNAPTNADLVAYETFPHFTPEWQPMGYHGAYTNLPGRMVSFYNPFDPVLDWWVYDQKHFKPSNSNYSYDGTDSMYYGVPSYVVTDPQESRSMVSRSRSLPVGQSGPASAQGVIKSAVDLHANFGFYDAFPDDHSAQWTWPIQTSRPYYLQVLESIKP